MYKWVQLCLVLVNNHMQKARGRNSEFRSLVWQYGIKNKHMVCHVISQWTFKKLWKRWNLWGTDLLDGWVNLMREEIIPPYFLGKKWRRRGAGRLICTEFCVICSWDYLWYLISGQAISREHCSTKLFLIGHKQRDGKQSSLRTAGSFPKEWLAVWSANAFFRWIREHQTV